MYKLLISEVAEKDLEKFSVDERIFIAEKLKYLAENFKDMTNTIDMLYQEKLEQFLKQKMTN